MEAVNSMIKGTSGKTGLLKKSISNKLYSILVIVSLFVLVIVLVATFTASTLTMVTSFARMERTHSVQLSNAKAYFYKYSVFEDNEILDAYKLSMGIATKYSSTFGSLGDLVKDTPHKQAVKTFDDTFTEADHRGSVIIIRRTGLLLWNPIVQRLISIAKETNKLTKEYDALVWDFINTNDPVKKEEILSAISHLEESLDDLPRQFSVATGELSEFASGVVKIALWALFFLLIAAAAFLIIPINRSITGSIKKVSYILADIAQGEGDLTVMLPVESQDEIGVLSQNFNVFIHKIRNSIREVVGNLEVQVKASNEINAASEKLNELANTQASSIEELASSMEEVKSSIDTNATNSNKTSETAKEVSLKAAGGGGKVAETAGNMREISSRIDVVEDIAFQINLLALNASVEAAHAGVHGKGFAVVAGEVKKLSEQTKLAAQDIHQLVESSTLSSDEAGKIVGEIVPQIKLTAALVEEISASTEEQTTTFTELNNAMNVLSKTAVESSGLANNLVDTFRDFDRRTKKLNSSMSFFKVD